MSDLISRQAAIDEIKEIYEWHDNVTKERIIEHFKHLPSAERRGRWEDYQMGKWIYAKCSECRTVHDVRSNYCPNCGARMEEEA